MSRTLPPPNALRAFEAAGRHQSFSRAAEELGVKHLAISRHVHRLGHRLVMQLFRDLPRGVELSPEGQAYLSRITATLDLIGDATEDLADVDLYEADLAVRFSLRATMNVPAELYTC